MRLRSTVGALAVKVTFVPATGSAMSTEAPPTDAGTPPGSIPSAMRPRLEGTTVTAAVAGWRLPPTVAVALMTTGPPPLPRSVGVKVLVMPLLWPMVPALPLSTLQVTFPLRSPFWGTAWSVIGSAPVSTFTVAGEMVSFGPTFWMGPSSLQASARLRGAR